MSKLFYLLKTSFQPSEYCNYPLPLKKLRKNVSTKVNTDGYTEKELIRRTLELKVSSNYTVTHQDTIKSKSGSVIEDSDNHLVDHMMDLLIGDIIQKLREFELYLMENYCSEEAGKLRDIIQWIKSRELSQ